MKRIYLGLLYFLIIAILGASDSFSEIKEEKEEKTLEVKKIQKTPTPYKFASRAALFSGHDNNVNLTPTRKGDIFEEFLYSLDFSTFLMWQLKFTFNYDLDVLNYNEITDASNILNHLRFGLHKSFSPFTVGMGYDLGILYYHHNEDGDFLFHKGFLYLKHDLSRKLYHKLQLEAGLKDYTHRKALADTIRTYQDDKREDERLSAEYSIGSTFIPKLRLVLKTKFSFNESNAAYLDFYDYKSYEGSLYLDYKLLKDISIFSNLTYIRKKYLERLVTLRDYKQRDNLYSGTMGLLYQLNKRNSFTVSFTYRQNASNDSLEDYSENVINCGWQYNF